MSCHPRGRRVCLRRAVMLWMLLGAAVAGCSSSAPRAEPARALQPPRPESVATPDEPANVGAVAEVPSDRSAGSLGARFVAGPDAAPTTEDEPPALDDAEPLAVRIEHQRVAAERARARGDEAAELRHRTLYGTYLKDASHFEEARPVLESCVALAQELGDRRAEVTALLELGAAHYSAEDHTRAERIWEHVSSLCREIDAGAEEARALGGLGLIAMRRQQYDESERYLTQAATRAAEVSSKEEESRAHVHLGLLYWYRSEFPRAIESFDHALALARRLGNRTTEATILINLGELHHHLGEYGRSRENLEGALRLYGELGDRLMEGRALGLLGAVYQMLGDYSRSHQYLEQKLAIATEFDHGNSQAMALVCLGVLSVLRGQYGESRDYYERALEITRRTGNRYSEAGVLSHLGNLHFAQGEYQAARQYYEETLGLAEEFGADQLRADTYGHIGNVYRHTTEHQKSIEYYQKQRELCERIGYRRGTGHALGGLGMVYEELGDIPRARDFLEKQVAMAREMGDLASEACGLGNLGNVFLSLGQYASARRLFFEQLRIAEQIGDVRGRGMALGSIGHVCHATGDYAMGKDYTEQALAQHREIGNRKAEAISLGNLGLHHIELGELDEAQKCHEAARDLARELGNRVAEGLALTNLGIVHHQRGNYVAALDRAEQGLAIFQELGMAEGILHGLMVVARAAIQVGDADRAWRALDDAAVVLDRPAVRALQIAEISSLRSRFGQWDKIAFDLTALRVEQAANEVEQRTAIAEGLSLAGRWKGRALLEGMLEQRRGARSKEALAVRDARREVLARRDEMLSATSQALRDEKPSVHVDGLRAQARRLSEKATDLAATLRRLSPRDASLELPLDVDPAALRGALRPRTALIEYGEGEQRLYAFVITGSAQRFLDLGEHASAREIVEEHLRRVSGVDRRDDAAVESTSDTDLFDRVLAPALAAAGEEIERLVIVPSRSLADVPFESLRGPPPGGGAVATLVADRYEVSYAPATGVFVLLRAAERRSGAHKLLVLADPLYPSEAPAGDADPVAEFASVRAVPEPGRFVRLQHTRAEALAIARLLADSGDATERASLSQLAGRRGGSFHSVRLDVYLGAAASRARLEGDLKQYSMLHFAAHGYVDRDSPHRTGIALAFTADNDGYLSIEQVLDLDLEASLVVLSACDTARGAVRQGEGVESLAWAFLYAGAESVVASLWRVDDLSTSILMEELYRNLLEKKLPKATALREAKKTLRTLTWEQARARLAFVERTRGGLAEVMPETPVVEGDPRPFAHPRFWAAFVLMGNPD